MFPLTSPQPKYRGDVFPVSMAGLTPVWSRVLWLSSLLSDV